MIFNVSQISKEITKQSGGNSYSYLKVSKMLSGIRGANTNKEIDQVIRLIERETANVVKMLENLKEQ
jgi:hypothetical protein